MTADSATAIAFVNIVRKATSRRSPLPDSFAMGFLRLVRCRPNAIAADAIAPPAGAAPADQPLREIYVLVPLAAMARPAIVVNFPHQRPVSFADAERAAAAPGRRTVTHRAQFEADLLVRGNHQK
jgi:hypothetical protein